MRNIRVALCQLESHPAIYTGLISYPEEPWVPAPEHGSLSRLGTKGIDVQELQETCGVAYAAWSEARLAAVVDYLKGFRPVPDIVLIPEGGVLVASLPLLSSWSADAGVTILAGTHTPLATPSSLRTYSTLGVTDKARKRATRARAGSVLPLIRNGRVALIPKTLSSPFERTDVSMRDPDAAAPEHYPIQTAAGKLDLLPMICIEALRLLRAQASYDVVGIVSYDAHPEQFQPAMDLQVRNRRPVLYCNDGRFGGTRIGLVHDARGMSWLGEVLPTGLPVGDAILMVDLDVDVAAVEVSTAAPRNAGQLIALASVVCEQGPSAAPAHDFHSIRGLGPGTLRADALARMLRETTLDPLQRLRASHLRDLEDKGIPTEAWWDALGTDCIVRGREDLRALERKLAATCRGSLMNLLTVELPARADLAPVFLGFYAECDRLAGPGDVRIPAAPLSDPAAVIDREEEVATVVSFFDSRTAVVLEVSGLLQIGKTAVIEKALAQGGVTPVVRVPLTPTSSPDYLIYSILKLGCGLPEPPYADAVSVIRSPAFGNALRSVRIVVVERAHHLVDGGGWRDERTGDVLSALVESARGTGTKLILESQRELPLGLSDPSLRKPLRVGGLNKHLRRFGEALFDAQLRRVGLAPDILTDEARSSIVERLGGHPVAIALAADASYEEGGEAVLSALADRRGFYLSFIRRLLSALSLTDEEQTILRLLTLARAPVDRSVVLSSVSFPAAFALRNLVALGAVEVANDGRVELAGVLRGVFDPQELPPEPIAAFHRAAAESFATRASWQKGDLHAAVEAEYHAGVVGITLGVSSRLLDGALATATSHFESQQYEAAATILEVLLRKQRSLEVLRLAAQVEARRNHPGSALSLAREVLTRDPKDTRLLAELAKIALTQYQDDTTAFQLISVARSVGVEDVSVLVVEGRLYLRRHQLLDAERVLQRARQLTQRNPWPYYYLGITYQRLGLLEDAIQILLEGQEFVYEQESRSRRALNAIRTQLGYAYLLAGDTEAAGQILDPLLAEEPASPEVARAYAALTIKRDGVQAAQKAFARLSEAAIRSRIDRCQFHLLYGLFHLGIGNPHEAAQEFARAHAADRSNVFVMMKWARTLYAIGEARYLDGDDSHLSYLSDCARLVRDILSFDPDNRDGVALMNSLHQVFGIDIERPDE